MLLELIKIIIPLVAVGIGALLASHFTRTNHLHQSQQQTRLKLAEVTHGQKLDLLRAVHVEATKCLSTVSDLGTLMFIDSDEEGAWSEDTAAWDTQNTKARALLENLRDHVFEVGLFVGSGTETHLGVKALYDALGDAYWTAVSMGALKLNEPKARTEAFHERLSELSAAVRRCEDNYIAEASRVTRAPVVDPTPFVIRSVARGSAATELPPADKQKALPSSTA